MNRRFLFAVLGFVIIAAPACQLPRFQGAQIQNPPLGFLLQDESFQARRMFPDRDLSFHTAWVHTGLSGVSVIYINGHPGAVGLDEVIAARDGVWNATTDPDAIFEDLEAITIDGREGWGWFERVYSERRGLVDVAYRAVVPYDTVTFAIEFISGEPNFKQYAPDTLRTIVSSFGIGRTTWNLPLIAVLAGAGLLLANMMRTRAQARATRLRNINFVTVKKDEETKDEGKKDEDKNAAAGEEPPGPVASSPEPTPQPQPAPPPEPIPPIPPSTE